MKGVDVIKRLSKMFQNSLLTICKSFVQLHLDYGDILYDQPNNKSSCQKIETIQYNAILAITGAIKGTSQVKVYNELGLDSLAFRRWLRKLCLSYETKKTGLPEYLFNMIPQSTTVSQLRMLQHSNKEQMYSNILISHVPFWNGTNLICK